MDPQTAGYTSLCLPTQAYAVGHAHPRTTDPQTAGYTSLCLPTQAYAVGHANPRTTDSREAGTGSDDQSLLYNAHQEDSQRELLMQSPSGQQRNLTGSTRAARCLLPQFIGEFLFVLHVRVCLWVGVEYR
jgi:hypothetical protein